jgi:complex iron-sulfur molybdoenzyme family reductase subunit gamma
VTPLLLTCALAATSAAASDAFFATEVVDAQGVKALPTTTTDAAWAGLPPKTFTLVPQRTIRLHDAKANAVLAAPGTMELSVRVAQQGAGLAVLLEWKDDAADVVRDDEVNTYADSVAVQVPVAFGKGRRLPAISMGDADAPVRVTMLRATKGGAARSVLTAAGFGSSTRQAPAEAKAGAMTYDAATKTWRALVEVAAQDAAAGLVPLSFAVWDGARLERSGNKRLSSWKFVRLAGKTPDPEYVKAMAWGYAPGDLGDVAKGKALAEAVCVSCHHLPGKAVAPAGLAPALLDVGAIATPGYLRESIVEPSAAILVSPNPNQHYAKDGPRDRFGAYPNNDGFAWFTTDASGQRTSKMPSFSGFTTEQLGDLVAFLKTLDGKGPLP